MTKIQTICHVHSYDTRFFVESILSEAEGLKNDMLARGYPISSIFIVGVEKEFPRLERVVS